MPLNFAGDPIWEEVIAGPSDAEAATGPSITDMGVLLANRTQWLKTRMIQDIDVLFLPGAFNSPTNTTTTWEATTEKATIVVSETCRVICWGMFHANITTSAEIAMGIWEDVAGVATVAASTELFWTADETGSRVHCLGVFEDIDPGTWHVPIVFRSGAGGGGEVEIIAPGLIVAAAILEDNVT